MAQRFFITVAVADLRREPTLFSHDYSHQEMRETQLLYGEAVEQIAENQDWVQVAALEQLYFDVKKGWLPLLGWVHKKELRSEKEKRISKYVVCNRSVQCGLLELSYGTLFSENDYPNLRVIPKIPSRAQIVEDAEIFVGTPYLWGGRASHLNTTISSVDCSGLINLLYRAQGMSIPRNAYDQYLFCHPTSQLEPGDPLYLAKENRINHVVLKLDHKTFIEAPKTGKYVRRLAWGSEIWEKDGKIYFFDRESPYTPYPGSFFS